MVPKFLYADDAIECSATDDEDEADDREQGHAEEEEDIGSLIDFIDDEEPDGVPNQDNARLEIKYIMDEDSDDNSSGHTTDDGIGDNEIEAMDIDDTTEAENSVNTEAETTEAETSIKIESNLE